MNGETVADIVPGAKDATNSDILTVYSKISGIYAVYRTRERVSVQFADDQTLGSEQRRALVKLNPLRGQINGLIDGWRAIDDDDYRPPHRLLFWRRVHACEIKAKVAMFDRRVSDALIMALQSDQDHAEILLGEIKADLLEERTSAARIDYVAVAALVTALLLIVSGIAGGTAFGLLKSTKPEQVLWLACGAGALGALFSTGIAMRTRQILTDLQVRENRTDAIVRICIGALAGVLLVAMLMAKVVSFDFGAGARSPDAMAEWGDIDIKWILYALVAFIGGFSERLVAGLLEKASAAAAAPSNPLAGATPPATGSGPTATETNPLGLQRSDDDTEAHRSREAPAGDDADGCLAEEEGGPDDATDDSQLPAATGGVEEIEEMPAPASENPQGRARDEELRP